MDLNVWLFLSLPILALLYALFYRIKGHLRLIPKCGATIVCAATAFAGLTSHGTNPLHSLLFWGIVACALGDALLELHFVSGICAFGLGHVLLIAWMMSISGGISWISVLIWLLAYLGALVMFREDLRSVQGSKAPFLLYPIVLMAMASIAALLPWRIGTQATTIALGGILFTVSDIMVAKGVFGKLSPAMDKLALALYYLAVYALALSTWML